MDTLYKLIDQEERSYHRQNGWIENDEDGVWTDEYPKPPLPPGTVAIVQLTTIETIYHVMTPPVGGGGSQIPKKRV